MQRYNPFADASLNNDPFTTSFNRSSSTSTAPGASEDRDQSPLRSDLPVSATDSNPLRFAPAQPPSPKTTRTGTLPRYTTSFPDPFGDQDEMPSASEVLASQASASSSYPNQAPAHARSNSVTFSPTISSTVANQTSGTSSPRSSSRRQPTPGSGFSSFLSRATSVTSSSVTDRVSGAVGSVRSAVDSISSQIQAVPSNLNERLGSSSIEIDQQAPQLAAAASYLTSKISSATGGASSGSLAVISRQRVILILEDPTVGADWLQQFNNYYRLTTGSTKGLQSAFSSFLSSAAAQLTSSSNLAINNNAGDDLIEQADFRDISILANQATSTATVFVQQSSCNFSIQPTSSATSSPAFSAKRPKKIVRPEYVVVRQRTKERLDYLRSLVNGFDYCSIPMFEPVDIWNTFQDRQLIFSRLLRVQKALGKESFPLIPQIFCQTHNDLLNYINSSSIGLPCLARVGPLGKGKIKIDNLQMLRDFASIMETSGLSCTLEQYLNVNYDLVVQKLGTSLKLFKRSPQPVDAGCSDSTPSASDETRQEQDFVRQTMNRSSAIGTSVLSSLMVSSSQQQQISRQSSNPTPCKQYEKLSNVSARQKFWVDAISREFNNELDVFCIKIVATKDDREYIIGLTDASMDFMGSFENQEEDRRSFVELIISKMNTILPKGQLSRELSRKSSGTQGTPADASALSEPEREGAIISGQAPAAQEPVLRDKRRFISQTNINNESQLTKNPGQITKGYGQLSSRSQSVSANQTDFSPEHAATNLGSLFSRRESDRSSSITGLDDSNTQDSTQPLLGTEQQTSFGQSIFNQTSTALNTLQKQSMSLFKRLDSRSDLIATPPVSAKSDQGFVRNFASNTDVHGAKDGFKSQSMDSSSFNGSNRLHKLSRGEPPAKPPPPQSLSYRQSSLASSSQAYRPEPPSRTYTPTTTPVKKANQGGSSVKPANNNQEGTERARVVRQHSALSAFAHYDEDLARSTSIRGSTMALESEGMQNASPDEAKKRLNSDSISTTSGDSSGTKEASGGEDTMNNLKKTFASIFGNKVE